MDQSYFTIRWQRLLFSLLILAGLYAIWLGVFEYQRGRLSDRLLTTARQLADGADSVLARTAYLDYLELHPEDSLARVELIQHVQKTERPGNERDAFVVSHSTRVLQNGNSLPELRLTLIDAAMRLEWFSTVSQLLPSVSSLVDQHPRLTAFSGTCRLKKGELDEAEAQFKTALLKDPACLPAWSGLIDLTELRGGAESAIVVARDWVAETSSSRAFFTLARLLVKAGRADEAAALYQTAELPDSDEVEQVRELAQFFVHELPLTTLVDASVLRRVYEATSSAVKEPSYDDLVCMADLAHRFDDVELAQRHYQQCLENRPGDLFATGRQVELFGSMGLHEQANKTLDGLTDSSSQKVLKTTLRARLMAQKSKFKEATIALESVIRLHSPLGVKQDCYALLVECLWKLRRFSEAAVRAEELLDLGPSSDNARRLCAEALIRSSRYDEAIKCIHGFTSAPEEQINAVWRMLAHADQTKQGGLLTKAVHGAVLINAEATVPVLFAAFKAADEGRTSDGIRLLVRTMVEQPRRSAFRIAIQATQDRALERIAGVGVTRAFELKDSTDRRIFLQKMAKTDAQRVATQITQLFTRSPDDSMVISLLERLLADLSDQRAAQRQILLLVYPELARVVQAQGKDAVPAIAEMLASSDFEDQALELLARSMRSDDTLPLVETFCRLMRSASLDSPFHVTQVSEALSNGRLPLSGTVREVLLAECDVLNRDFEAAARRLLPLVSTTAAPDAALLIMMTHADVLKFHTVPALNRDSALRSKYPDNPAVLLASSRWNRSKGLYSISAGQARHAFLISQRPEILVELAYSEWLGNYTNRASDLVALSLDLKSDFNDLQPLHQDMLQQMQADPRMELQGLSRETVRAESNRPAL